MENYSASIRVIETIRGDKAWELIKAANMFNKPAPEGKEYILAKIAVSALAVKDDKALNVNALNFSCFSSNNEKYDSDFTIVPPKPNFSASIYAGGNTEGYAVFTVDKSDASPKIVYSQNYDGSGGIWFALQ